MRITPLLALLLLGCGKDDPEKNPYPSTAPTTTSTPVEVLKFEGDVPKNLLFISIDTLRKDHVGPHSELGLTPWMSRIAAEGVVMNNHLQCSNWTYGSTTCTLAGRTNPERGHQPRLGGPTGFNIPVPSGTPFLATWLGELGFYSQVVCANAWMSDTWGNTQGYDRQMQPAGDAILIQDESLELFELTFPDFGKDRWFMHQHHTEPHAPYSAPSEYDVGIDQLEPWPGGDLKDRDYHYEQRDLWPYFPPDMQDLLEQHLRVMYAGEVRLLDERLEANWDELEAGGYLDDTLVVIWTDHGEEFWDHGFQTHAFNLTGEENDAVLIFWSKNIVPGSWDGPTTSIDLVPTLLDLYGADMPPEVTGVPIGSASPERAIFTEAVARTGGVQAVVKDGWKLHYNWADGSLRLWDRNVDPMETNNLFRPDHPKAQELWALLKPKVVQMAPLVEVPQPTWPENMD